MYRRLVPTLALLLTAAACSSSPPEAGASYFEDAAAISTGYESVAAAHFAEYRTLLEAATAETGDQIFVDANKGLFESLANDFGRAVTDLSALTPPTDAVQPHEAWVAAAGALNDAFQSTDDQLAPLTEAPAVNAVVSTVPLADLQADYRAACRAVAALADGESIPAIACDPVSGGA
ncbi:MAG: hypothetical protein OEP52_02600 [Acidimicrobiia bacterium]|nr:hypothetical protein [Acidimicrobiia bacterium]